MKTGFITVDHKINERTRLSEFSMLLATLGIDPAEFSFISHEAHGGFHTDIEAVRTISSRISRREDRVVAAYLPSFKNHLPESMFVEQQEESDHHPGVMEDKYLEFWSAFDTITYRFWIAFYVFKLKMLFFLDDSEVELLYWERLGGELPSVSREDRRYLLLLRLFAPFFRGRKMLYEKILPAFVKKQVEVTENVYSQQEIPTEYQNRLGNKNSYLARDFVPGSNFRENHSTYRLTLYGLNSSDIDGFGPNGVMRSIVRNLSVLFAPAHLVGLVNYKFVAGLRPFVLGVDNKSAYLGFSTFLRESK